MSARDDLRQQVKDEMLAGAMILALQADVAALRARVVVAEEDADRLAAWANDQRPCKYHGQPRRTCGCGVVAVVAAHRVAVSSRPKADPQPDPLSEYGVGIRGQRTCACQQPDAPGVVHRNGLPCYQADPSSRPKAPQ